MNQFSSLQLLVSSFVCVKCYIIDDYWLHILSLVSVLRQSCKVFRADVMIIDYY